MRWLLILMLLLPAVARAQSEQQTLVDRATLSLQDLLGDEGGKDARELMKRAKGAMVCPQVFKAGFILGGQGGGCVLVGRGPAGQGWTGPAFYGMGSGSVGLQAGISDSQLLFILLTDKGLTALMDNQFKIGGDASVALATIGGGIQGATTAAAGADIVAFGRSRGLFAGVSLDGSIIGARSGWNQVYYGQPFAAQQIVRQYAGANNSGAQPLRETLARFSGP